jgi:hypothetical protein
MLSLGAPNTVEDEFMKVLFALLSLLPTIALAGNSVEIRGEEAAEIMRAINIDGLASSGLLLGCEETSRRCQVSLGGERELYLYQSMEARRIYEALLVPEHETRLGKMKVLAIPSGGLEIVCSRSPLYQPEPFTCTIKISPN